MTSFGLWWAKFVASIGTVLMDLGLLKLGSDALLWVNYSKLPHTFVLFDSPKYRWFNYPDLPLTAATSICVSNFAAPIPHLWTHMDVYGGTMPKGLWYSLANCLDNRHVAFETSTAPRIFALLRVSHIRRVKLYMANKTLILQILISETPTFLLTESFHHMIISHK